MCIAAPLFNGDEDQQNIHFVFIISFCACEYCRYFHQTHTVEWVCKSRKVRHIVLWTLFPSNTPFVALVLRKCQPFYLGWPGGEHLTDDITTDNGCFDANARTELGIPIENMTIYSCLLAVWRECELNGRAKGGRRALVPPVSFALPLFAELITISI